MESLLWWELRGSLITFYWCGQIIKTNRAEKKKFSTPNGALGYLWFSTKWWKKQEILTLRSPVKHHRRVINWGNPPLSWYSPQSLSLNSLFWMAWCIIHHRASRSESNHLSPSPQLHSSVSLSSEGRKETPTPPPTTSTWLWSDRWSIGVNSVFSFYLNANRGQSACLLPMSSCLHHPT